MGKNHEVGFGHFKKSDGTMSNADIAELVGASESTVRKWKSRYKWNEQLGIEKSVTPSKKNNVTKNVRDLQQKRIVDSLVEAGTYSPALDLLIEIYLDCFEQYQQSDRQDEKLRKELARLLGQLGLDGKNKDLIKRSGVLLEKQVKEEEEKKKEDVPHANKLLQFRQRVSK